MLNYQHILYAIEQNEEENKALTQVIAFAKKLGANVSLLHVMPIPIEAYTYVGAYMDSEGIHETMLRDAKKYLHNIAKKVGMPEEQTEVLEGNISKNILEHAEKNSCDAIVLNGHNHNFFGRMLSTADALINMAKCDVIILKG